MARKPQKPQKGQPAIKEIYNSVCDIIDYLPSLEVTGDQKSIYVTKSSAGTVIHAKQPITTSKSSTDYIAGSGIVFTSGNIINAKLSAGPNINIDYNSGWLVISGTPAGSGGGGGGSGYTYTGDGDLGSGHIFVNYSYTDPVICSNLRYIDDLLNYPISGDIIGSELHFAQIRDIKDGAGTSIEYHWNSAGDHTEEGGGPDTLIKFIDGVCVNLNVSGGTYITTNFHQGVGYGDYTSASIDCNLSGTYDWYPHTSGFIAIVPQYDLNQNITGGIISTNLHAGNGITIDPQTGQISCTDGGNVPTPVANTVLSATSNGTMQWTENTGGGGGDRSGWPNYNNLGEESDTLVYPLMRYSTSTGGWLRISCKSGTSRCVGVWIGDNYYGLGTGVMTWSLAIPPASSFYVDVDWGLNNRIWFDSTVTPSTVTNQQYDYWFTPPQWDPNRQTISEVRTAFDNARSEETQCYNYMIGAATDLRQMSSDWTKLTMISGSDPSAEPYSRQYYEDRITSMQKKLSGDENDWGCEQHWDEAITYCQTLNTLNTSLPSANPMYSYQVTDIPAKCQQYYGKIEQYITSGQYYYDLVDQWWTQHEQQNQ